MTAVDPGQVEGYQLSPQQCAAYMRDGDGRSLWILRSVPAIDLAGVAARMRHLTEEHEILRTRYAAISGLRVPVQVVDPPGEVSIERRLDGATLLRAGELTVEHRIGPDSADLVLGLPRLSVDRTSWSLLTDLLLGGAPTHVAEQLQYADAAGWLNEELERRGSGAHPLRPPAALPFPLTADCGDPDAEPTTSTWTIDGSELDRLEAVAGHLGVSEAAVLLAAWRSLCVRYGGKSDDHVLVVTEGRATEGMGALLGLLDRPVPVRLPVEGENPFSLAARSAGRALADAMAGESGSDPGTSFFADAASFRYQRDEWAAHAERSFLGRSELPGVLHLDCVRGLDELFVMVAGTGGRVTEADLVSFAEAFKHLLASALADSARAVGLLRLAAPTVTRAERREPLPSVLRRFLEQSERTPERPALRCAGGVLSYRELARQAEDAAEALRRKGVQAGDLVPVRAGASAETLAAMMGAWLAGAAFVPLDPTWPAERIETIERQLTPALAPTSTDAAYVIFTSGTSGMPKGVVIGHDQLAHYAAAISAELRTTEGAAFAAVSTLAADLSYTAIFPTLAEGGCVHLIDPAIATDPRALAEWLTNYPVAAMKLVPSHLSALLADADDPRALLPREVLVLGGEVFPRPLLDRVRELAPRLRVYNHYGPTETTIGAACLLVGAAVDERCASVPLGGGLGDNVLTIVDGEGNPLPPWCPGEVLISGPGVGLGYLAELRESRSGFGAHGSAGESPDRYRSGDLGRLVPGHGVEILGRLDDQAKVRGYRVQLGEIEALLRGQPGVADAAVVTRADDSGLVTHLDAYVVRTGPDAASTKELREALAKTLPAAVLPTGWRVLDRLPLTRNGKLDRHALPPVERRRAARARRPRDPVEQRLLVLWAEALGDDDLGLDDDFFDLGGHSLTAIKLISRVNNAFGCRLPMSSVFGARTVTAMADLVRGGGRQDAHLVPLRAGRGGSPLFCLHPGGGTTLSYWELSRLLPADLRVVGVESRGLHGGPAHESFAEMAESYAAAVAESAQGPVVLVGWCFGGLLAFETAEALRRSGHEVAQLIVIDCPAPGAPDEEDGAQQSQPLTESTLVGRFAWHYELDLPTSLPPAPYDVLLHAMRRKGFLPPSAGEAELRALFDVYAANMRAIRRHFEDEGATPSHLDYPVLLVRAEPPGEAADIDPTWGWRELVGPELRFASVAADHHGIMREPAVRDLAASITQELPARGGRG
ncbi:alpha/beta fold hydrolase [Microbispora amethystogenes]|uniref:non-ribosomal peptide synthetase n=1 Tax=Microbispora amethystogenes TaxID=1427754 RepID=UPI00340B8687